MDSKLPQEAIDDDTDDVNLFDRIRQAMVEKGIEHYSMSLVESEAIAAVVEAVNIGIDAHLSACYCPDRGDSYQHGDRSITATSDTRHWKAGDKLQLAQTLECRVSSESLPVLLRRLNELESEAAWELRSSILSTLEIEE